MIQLQHEPLTMGLVAEMEPLLAAHYEELTLHKEVVKLRPRWTLYLQMQHMGSLHVLTARLGGKRLVGYSLFFVGTHMHYADVLTAENDVFYVHPDFRRGTLPLRLVRFTRGHFTSAARQAGHARIKIIYHCKQVNNLCAILKRMGMSHEEEVVAEII